MRFAFVASDTAVAQQARDALVQRYGDVPPGQAELIVALGGDGFMLRTLHAYRDLDVPVYGMKLGQVGFLMNMHQLDHLPERIERAHVESLFPLEMRVTDVAGRAHVAKAFNEVSLLRQSNQAAHLEVQLNGTVKLTSLVWSACCTRLGSSCAGRLCTNHARVGLRPLISTWLRTKMALTYSSQCRPSTPGWRVTTCVKRASPPASVR